MSTMTKLDDQIEHVRQFLERADQQEHDERCLKSHRKWMVDALYFLAAHPDACQYCYGTGFFEYSENMSPLGSGHYWPMPMTEPCEHCEGEGRCPVCGRLTIDEDGERACGCSPKENVAWPPECYCWMQHEWEWEEDYAGREDI